MLLCLVYFNWVQCLWYILQSSVLAIGLYVGTGQGKDLPLISTHDDADRVGFSLDHIQGIQSQSLAVYSDFHLHRNTPNSIWVFDCFHSYILTPVTTVAEDRQRIAEIIDSALSPENLTCDGELSPGQVRSRYRELTTVARELQTLDPSVTFYEFS